MKLYFFIIVQHTGDTDLGQAECESYRVKSKLHDDINYICIIGIIRELSRVDIYIIYYMNKEPLTIRRTLLPSFLVNFSTFAFLFNFSFMK